MTNSDYRSTIGSFAKNTRAALLIALVAASAVGGCTTTQGTLKQTETPLSLVPTEKSPPVRVFI